MTDQNDLMKAIIEYPKLNWKWIDITSDPNITWDFITDYIIPILNKYNLTFIIGNYWYNISKHHCVTFKIIQDNPDLPWNWNGVSINPNITWDII